MKFTSLGDRMKDYESVPRTRLVRRTPVLARLDGRAFHTFTRGLKRPYDADFHACMWAAAAALCDEIAECRFAYVQSDEITLLIVDYEELDTQAWFHHEVQKTCSVAASVCTVAFYAEHLRRFPDRKVRNLPTFDARFWNIPKEEVANALIWRQQDASRNSLSMLCQANFPRDMLHGKKNADQHELLHSVGINWNDLPTAQKRGVCIVRREVPVDEKPSRKARWVVDDEIPIFTTPEGRAYIERFVYPPDPDKEPSDGP